MINSGKHWNISTIGYVWNHLLLKSTLPIKIMSRNNSKQISVRGTLLHIPNNIGYRTSKVTLKVIGCGGGGQPKSLIVESDRMNYLFNCGEGTQRLANEHKCRLPKLKHILFTAANWTNLGGLPGLCLTMQAFDVDYINIFGPQGTIDVLNAVRYFVCLDKISIQNVANMVKNTYEDNVMTITNVVIEKKAEKDIAECDNNEITNTDCEYSKSPTSEKDDCGSPVRKMQRIANPASAEWNFSENAGKINHIVSYICKLKPTMGTLSLEKCVEKGVEPGPNLRLLKEGHDITLPDGTVVLSKDVCSPQIDGLRFSVVECPSEEYLDNFVNSQEFEPYHQSSQKPCESMYCIVHFTTERIMQHPKYKKWMNKFGPETYHLILNESNECPSGISIYKNQCSLHTVAPEIFPLLRYAPTPRAVLNKEDGCGPIVPGMTLITIKLKSIPEFDLTNLIPSPETLYEEQLQQMAPIMDRILAINAKYQEEAKLFVDSAEYPKFVMLGTGSSIPNKLRNVSGILIRLDETSSIILDCGEGTYGQLYKYYGKETVKDILASIKMIYISHLHADHHLGILSILMARHSVTSEPVALLLPERLLIWLSYYDKRFQDINSFYRAYANRDLLNKEGYTMNKSLSETLSSLKIKNIQTTLVAHCVNSYGVSITLENGQQIVYSGDTMPCQSLVNLGKNCDLLIHEATMEDGLEDQATKKLHSTISQAIMIGKQMNAKNILLTHFSQRYSKLPCIPDSVYSSNNIAIAYDYMEFSLSKFPLLTLLSPAYEIIYREFKEQLLEKAVKRMNKHAVSKQS